MADRSLVALVQQLKASGQSNAKIAAQLGIGKSTVFDYLKGSYNPSARTEQKVFEKTQSFAPRRWQPTTKQLPKPLKRTYERGPIIPTNYPQATLNAKDYDTLQQRYGHHSYQVYEAYIERAERLYGKVLQQRASGKKQQDTSPNGALSQYLVMLGKRPENAWWRVGQTPESSKGRYYDPAETDEDEDNYEDEYDEESDDE